MQFLDGGLPLGAPVALADGVATLPVPALGGGSHQITARYLGEGALDASESAAVSGSSACPAASAAPCPATLALTLGASGHVRRVHAGLDQDLHGVDDAPTCSRPRVTRR